MANLEKTERQKNNLDILPEMLVVDEVKIRIGLDEMCIIAAKLIRYDKTIVENLLRTEGHYGCSFPDSCNRFPCEKMTCNADTCTNGWAHKGY